MGNILDRFGMVQKERCAVIGVMIVTYRALRMALGGRR
jgi:hypothetical protein